MNPNQLLDALAAHMAQSPDAAIAQHMISALRVIAVRGPAGSIRPASVVNLTGDRPRDTPDDRPDDALAMEIAELRTSVQRAALRGDHGIAQQDGRRLAVLEHQLAERQRLAS